MGSSALRGAPRDAGLLAAGRPRGTHPLVGELTLDYETLTLDADDGLRMALYTAEADSTSQQALDLLASWSATPTPHQGRRLDEAPDQ